MKIIISSSLNPGQWNKILVTHGVSSPWHTSEMLDYYSKSCSAENLSFLLKSDQDQLIGVCPFFDCEREILGFGRSRESSVNGSQLPAPLLIHTSSEKENRKRLRAISAATDEIASRHNIACARYVHRPYAFSSSGSTFTESTGLCDLLANGFFPTIQQTFVVDLRKTQDLLESDLAQFHRKEIRRAFQQGQVTRVVDAGMSFSDLVADFQTYQAAHFHASGRRTRPQVSFDAMLEMLQSGFATLFINELDGVPISCLFCGQRNGFAFGWSQANTEAASGISARHLLEWSAILHYKKLGFYLYDIGSMQYETQFGVQLSEKEKSISFFKERFGGIKIPQIGYIKYFRKEFAEFELQSHCSHMTNFIERMHV